MVRRRRGRAPTLWDRRSHVHCDFGDACDYAVCVWNTAKGVLFCARDHIGARPLYYALENGRFVSATAVEAVLAAPGVPDALDETMVATHLASTKVSDTHTALFAAAELIRGQPQGEFQQATIRERVAVLDATQPERLPR